jgi:hypothetical protein
MFAKYHETKIIHSIENIPADYDGMVLHMDKLLYPVVGFYKELVKLGKAKQNAYLSEDKKIKYVYYKTDEISDTISLFVEPKKANPITHILFHDEYDYFFVDVYKEYCKSYNNIFTNNNIVYKALYKIDEKLFHTDLCYHLIYYVDDKSCADFVLNFTYNTNIYKHVRHTVISNCNRNENNENIKTTIKKYNGTYLNIKNIAEIQKMLLWFEHCVIITNQYRLKQNIFNILNKNHKMRDILYIDGNISCVARKLVVMNILSNNITLYIDKNNIWNHLLKKLFILLKKDRKDIFRIKHGHDAAITTLMKIKDYENVRNIITLKLNKTYDMGSRAKLMMKKIGIHFLLDRIDADVEKDILGIITVNINNIGIITALGILINAQPASKNKIKEFFYYQILENYLGARGFDNAAINYYKLFLALPGKSENSIKLLLKCTKELINKLSVEEQKIQLLFSISNDVSAHIDKQEVQDLYNALLELNSIDINKLIGLHKIKKCSSTYLISHALKFNVYDTTNNIVLRKEEIKKNLNELEHAIDSDQKVLQYTLDNILTIHPNNFYLSYQGESSKDIFVKKTNLIRKMCPELNYQIDTNFKNKKINICFHSNFLTRRHSVYKDRHQVIKNMSEDSRFNVYFTTFSQCHKEVIHTFGQAKHIVLPTGLRACKNILTGLKLDILVYCEIGMCSTSYFLAHMKLAKIQLNTWGHSDTSGIDNIDYFVSSKLYEDSSAQSNYSEKLILMDSLSTCYVSPLSLYKNQAFMTRHQMGFFDESIIYFCMQSAFKFAEEYDEYIINILDQNKNSIILLINNEFKTKISKRFENKNVGSRMHFIDMQEHFKFMNYMYISDIILDPYPFGGCNSSMEGFDLGKPIVTKTAKMINGRFTTGFYKAMGLPEYISNTKEEYIDFAVRLGQDKEYYKKVSKDIEQNKNKLFMTSDTLEEWKTLCFNLSTEYKNNSSMS